MRGAIELGASGSQPAAFRLETGLRARPIAHGLGAGQIAYIRTIGFWPRAAVAQRTAACFSSAQWRLHAENRSVA
jgi:hypothetical protein